MKKATGILILVFSLAALSWIACEFYHATASSPGEVDDYWGYQENMPEPRAASVIKKEGREFYVFFGPIAFLALPSGAPAYIFDEKGDLVDWSRDIGEDPRFTRSWKNLEVERMSAEEADLILKKKMRSNQPE